MSIEKLAEHLGIISEYIDQSGTEKRKTTNDTRVALLAAMGIEVADDASAGRKLAELEAARPAVPRTLVGNPALEEAASVRIVGEDGVEHRIDGLAGVTLDLPIGAYSLTIESARGTFEQRRIVVPETCPPQKKRGFGLTAQLYAVRSERNWGIGDLTDLRTLAERARSVGAAFVGINPLHALENDGAGISPYSPVSRLFKNWIYLDVEAIPEVSAIAPELRTLAASLRAGAQVQYGAVARLKREVLESAFARVERAGIDAYLEEQGEELRTFATFSAIADVHGFDFRRWPEELQSPSSPEVARFAAEHSSAIAFHAWLQREIDRQLGLAAESGLSIGLYQDLAIGCSPSGSDMWAYGGLFARGASIGAPPDSYSAEGQNWGLPPIVPFRLVEDGYRYFQSIVRRSLRHAGALRMDHAIGLFRQFWVPEGKSGRAGAFVRYPYEDLLGIVALEATRAKAIVVGEDLGTVPAAVPAVLASREVLSSRVLYFEIADGKLNPPESYPERALTTANTHDMAPLAGFWVDRDIELKVGAGIETDEASARAARARDRTAIASSIGVPTNRCDAPVRAAVHDFLAKTASVLVGVSLDDVIGEVEPVNLPGASPERHPSWVRKHSVSLEALDTAAIPESLANR